MNVPQKGEQNNKTYTSQKKIITYLILYNTYLIIYILNNIYFIYSDCNALH